MTSEEVKMIATEALVEVNYAKAYLEKGFLTLAPNPINWDDARGWMISLCLAEKDPNARTVPRTLTVPDGQPEVVKANLIARIEEKLSKWHDLIYPPS